MTRTFGWGKVSSIFTGGNKSTLEQAEIAIVGNLPLCYPVLFKNSDMRGGC
jgi:hypothetical protein